MAIDSLEKRKSITGIHQYANGPGVTMMATPDVEWRYEAGYSYPFELAGAPAPGAAAVSERQFIPMIGKKPIGYRRK